MKENGSFQVVTFELLCRVKKEMYLSVIIGLGPFLLFFISI